MTDSTASTVGLVLSGGGSRGVAHIGVIRALLERGVRPDCVAGVSAGAVVGALYAADYSPEEMLRFFETRSPFRLSNLSLSKAGLLDADKVVSNFEDYFPQNSFESLHRKLSIVATDMMTGRPAVFDAGPLIPAILASSALPFVFSPVEIEGRVYSDGGIVDNFPVGLIHGRCDRIVGIYASPLRVMGKRRLSTSLSVLQRALEVGIFHTSKAKFQACDIVIRPRRLTRFSPFDMKHLRQIEEVGYLAAMQRMDEIEVALELTDSPP